MRLDFCVVIRSWPRSLLPEKTQNKEITIIP
jgi:hypothetical protein